MFILKKAYCRTRQSLFHLAIPVLPYRSPKQIPSVTKLPEVLKKDQINRVLIITDGGIQKLGLLDSLTTALKDAGMCYTVYDKTVANPTSSNVEEARKLYLDFRAEALIGFGGGSSIDCAKAVGARLVKPNQTLGRMEGILRVHKKLPPLIAVPTTAGTGSETTVAAVITDSDSHHKYAITDFFLIPDYAVLDPELTRTLPKFLTACTAMDALTHAVEAYIGRSTTRDSRSEAIIATRLIFNNLDRAFEDGNDMIARKNLLDAANLAGSAFSKSYVGYVHAVAHSLSGKYNLPHGYTNAVLLPWVLEKYGKTIHKKLHKLAIAAGVAEKSDSHAYAAAAFIREIRLMNARYGIQEQFKEIQSKDITILAKTADREANPLYPVPVLMNARELEGIYETVREG